MEHFPELKGLILTSDPTAPPEGYVTGGQNMVKRLSRGMKRRQGFGAFDVESAAAVLNGSSITNPRATFPFGSSVLGLHDGILTKYDGSDSFDAFTKNLVDSPPTLAELGGYKLIATGGRPLMYDGSAIPKPLGSKRIDSFESTDPDWTDGGATANVEFSKSTDNYLNGSQALKAVASAAGAETASAPAVAGGSVNYGTPHGTTYTQLGYRTSLVSTGQMFSGLGGNVISQVMPYVYDVTSGPLTADVTLRIQYADASGLPDGVDIYSQVIPKATFSTVGYHSIVLSTPPLIADNGKTVCVIFEADPTETKYVNIATQHASAPNTMLHKDGANPWITSEYALDMRLDYHVSGSLDLYTGYGNTSKIIINSKILSSESNLNLGATTYIRFKTDASNYFTYEFASSDLGVGAWTELQLARGANDGTGGDFTATLTPTWDSIATIEIGLDFSGADTVYFDDFFLLHEYAPPASNKVFVADGRAFVFADKRLYYSEKWNPNRFYVDTYMDFPYDGVAVVQAGPNVLFLTDSDAWAGYPLSQFPDYRMEKLSLFGCVDRKAAIEATVKNKVGAAWVSRNHGAMFWSGYGQPVPLSNAVSDIFLKGGANTQNMDYSRSSEIVMFFHARHSELWILYPTLYTSETNLKYGLIFNCDTGEWMPLFVWNGTNNLVYGTVYRDPNDSLYKVLLTDSTGAVFHEGFVGSTGLSDTTSRDGYVDANTTGGAVKGYVEIPYVDNLRDDKANMDQIFHDINVKYITGTTSEFSLDFDYRVAQKGSGVDKDTYPNEEEVVSPVAFTDLGARATTANAATDVIERNVKLGADIIGHAISVRAGQIDSGGSVEWELLGLKVDKGAPRYGRR